MAELTCPACGQSFQVPGAHPGHLCPVPRDVIDAEGRKVITMARELAALSGPAALAAHTGSDPGDVLGAYAAALGEAKTLLRALAAITERLAGDEQAHLAAESATAVTLLGDAMHLRVNGERAPGGNETWPDWDRKAEAFLRARWTRLHPELRDERMPG